LAQNFLCHHPSASSQLNTNTNQNKRRKMKKQINKKQSSKKQSSHDELKALKRSATKKQLNAYYTAIWNSYPEFIQRIVASQGYWKGSPSLWEKHHRIGFKAAIKAGYTKK